MLLHLELYYIQGRLLHSGLLHPFLFAALFYQKTLKCDSVKLLKFLPSHCFFLKTTFDVSYTDVDSFPDNGLKALSRLRTSIGAISARAMLGYLVQYHFLLNRVNFPFQRCLSFHVCSVPLMRMTDLLSRLHCSCFLQRAHQN